MKRLASSIHAIHRPLARSLRVPIPHAFKAGPRSSPAASEELEDVSSDEDLENDFEETPRLPEAVPSHLAADAELPESAEGGLSQEHPGGLATIRLDRRMRLAEKLKDVFELDGINEVLAGKSKLQIVTCVLTITRQRCLAG